MANITKVIIKTKQGRTNWSLRNAVLSEEDENFDYPLSKTCLYPTSMISENHIYFSRSFWS